MVFAVLLALAVNEWRDNRANTALAARARAAVIEELRANAAELDRVRDTNEALREQLETALPALRSGDTTKFDITYSVALLSSSAWHAAQVTQAVHFMDFEWVARVSKAYDLQEFYVDNQAALVDRIGSMGELAEASGPAPMATAVLGHLRVVINMRAALEEAYDELLSGDAGG